MAPDKRHILCYGHALTSEGLPPDLAGEASLNRFIDSTKKEIEGTEDELKKENDSQEDIEMSEVGTSGDKEENEEEDEEEGEGEGENNESQEEREGESEPTDEDETMAIVKTEVEEIPATDSQSALPQHRFPVPLSYFDQQRLLILRTPVAPKPKEPKSKPKKDFRLRNGMLTVTSLGTIEDSNPNYCTEDLLFPCGFHAYRLFWSYAQDTVQTEARDRPSDGKSRFFDAYRLKTEDEDMGENPR